MLMLVGFGICFHAEPESSVHQHLCPNTEAFRATWTPRVCGIMAFCRAWAIIVPKCGGLGRGFRTRV